MVRDAPLTTALAKTKAALAFLGGKAKEQLQVAYNKRQADNGLLAETEKLTHDEVLAIAIDDVGKAYFPSDHAYLRQVNYMRHHLYMVDTTLHEFKDRLLLLNS